MASPCKRDVAFVHAVGFVHPSHEMCKTNDGLGVVSILEGCQGGVRKCRLTASIKYFTD